MAKRILVAGSSNIDFRLTTPYIPAPGETMMSEDVGNADWPNTNVKCFRYYASDGVYAAGEQDGRWRFLLHDIDSAFGRYSLPGEKEDAKSEDYIRVISQKSDLRYSPLLDALLKREDCRQHFIERTLYYLEEAVSYEKVSDVLEQLQAERDEELDYYLKHLELLKDKDKSLAKTIGVTADSVKRQIDTILRFAEYRPQFVKQQLNQLFDCGLE